ncbi:MAG TPA: hypothetical protein VF026_00215 [Ktedonobacteraceae bacterium]
MGGETQTSQNDDRADGLDHQWWHPELQVVLVVETRATGQHLTEHIAIGPWFGSGLWCCQAREQNPG